VIVSLKAIATMAPNFSRLCGPLRGRLEVTVAETGNNIGFNMTGLQVIFNDQSGIWFFTIYNAARLTTEFGSNHFNAGQSRILASEAVYPLRVDTISTAVVAALVTDDAGATTQINERAMIQPGGC
jgi:hypothetical protein